MDDTDCGGVRAAAGRLAAIAAGWTIVIATDRSREAGKRPVASKTETATRALAERDAARERPSTEAELA